MKLIDKTPKALQCFIGQCPAIFETDRDSCVVIGKILSSEQVSQHLKGRVGEKEVAVEFPKKLLGNIIPENK